MELFDWEISYLHEKIPIYGEIVNLYDTAFKISEEILPIAEKTTERKIIGFAIKLFNLSEEEVGKESKRRPRNLTNILIIKSGFHNKSFREGS